MKSPRFLFHLNSTLHRECTVELRFSVDHSSKFLFRYIQKGQVNERLLNKVLEKNDLDLKCMHSRFY